MLSLGDRQRGCLLGLAVGDAVGAHVRVGGVHRRGEAWAAKLGAITQRIPTPMLRPYPKWGH